MMKKVYCMIVLLLGISTLISAQTKGTLSGRVVDDAGKPLEYVTMMLLNESDSSLAKGAITNAEGAYEFSFIKEGKYVVKASMVGYEKAFSQTLEITAERTSISVPALKLTEQLKALQAVVVEAQRPMIEQQVDRMVVNVEGSILASGGTAMEVLEKSPGIAIDQDDNIQLKGKQGVIIMIDGKPTYLSSQQVANMLKNMPSNAIEKIEIINNPSAKYDASGNSGIINIKTKKNKNHGMNGSLTLGTGYGKYEKATGGLNLNYRNARLNAFGDYNYSYNRRFNSMRLTRRITDDNITYVFDQQNYRPGMGTYNTFKAGLDYYLNDKNTIGILFNGFTNNMEVDSDNETFVNRTNDNVLVSNQNTYNSTQQDLQSFNYNINYVRTFNKPEQELILDFTYSIFNGDQNDRIETHEKVADAAFGSLFLSNSTPSEVEIKVAKLDYSLPTEKLGKFDMGVKSSFVTTDNDVVFKSLEGEVWKTDPVKTNHFIYDENIKAAYIDWMQQFGNYSVKAGLRAEHTLSEGNSITLDSVFTRDYLEFFPSVFVSRKINDNNQFGFSYSRRIDRPSYQDVNPFVYFLDPYTFFQGNPNLMPQFTNAFEMNYTFKKMYTASIGYSHTNDVYTQVTEQIDSTKVTRATNVNLASLDNYNLTLNAPVTVAKWWNMNNNLNMFYNRFQGEYLEESLDNSRFSWMLNINNRFTLPAGFSAELSGRYNSPNVYGIIRMKSMYMISAGIQKSFWNRKASLKLNVNDIFNTMRFRGHVDYANMDIKIENRWESRQARLTFTYQFGNSQVKQARRRRTGAEDEQNRIKIGGS